VSLPDAGLNDIKFGILGYYEVLISPPELPEFIVETRVRQTHVCGDVNRPTASHFRRTKRNCTLLNPARPRSSVYDMVDGGMSDNMTVDRREQGGTADGMRIDVRKPLGGWGMD